MLPADNSNPTPPQDPTFPIALLCHMAPHMELQVLRLASNCSTDATDFTQMGLMRGEWVCCYMAICENSEGVEPFGALPPSAVASPVVCTLPFVRFAMLWCPCGSAPMCTLGCIGHMGVVSHLSGPSDVALLSLPLLAL